MVTLGGESVLIGNPGEGEALAFGGDPVGSTLVGVTLDGLVRFLAIRVLGDSLQFLLGLGFIAGGSVRSSVAVNIIALLIEYDFDT